MKNKSRLTKVAAYLLTMAMLLTMIPVLAVSASAEDDGAEVAEDSSFATKVTYSLFDVRIPFKNMVDCQRTTSTSIGSTQKMHKFAYVFTENGYQINNYVDDVVDNPDDYYYKFSETSNGKISLSLYKYNDSSFTPYVLFSTGYIQSYGDGCFIYAGGSDGHYGNFVSFRDKDYHFCSDKENGCESHTVSASGCLACGCGEEFIIRGYNPTIEELKALPMSDDLVDIEHEHKYDDFTGKCPCGDYTPGVVALPEAHNVYVGGLGMGDGSVPVYYVNGKTDVTTIAQTTWNAKLEKANGKLTLTLNGLTLDGTSNYNDAGIYLSKDTSVSFSGNNTIKGSKYGIYSTKSVYIDGEGTLKVVGANYGLMTAGGTIYKGNFTGGTNAIYCSSGVAKLLPEDYAYCYASNGNTISVSSSATSVGSANSETTVKSTVLYIGTAEELIAFAASVNSGNTYSGGKVKLTSNIDLSDITSFTPIGNSSYQFQGTFDGDFHVITGLTINNSGRYTGLFGKVYNATIKNLGLENVNIIGSASDVGGIAGNAQGGSFERCYVTGTVKGAGGVGGILGSTHSSSYPTTIQNCYTRVTVVKGASNTMDYAGISGWNASTSVKIQNCYSACIGEMRPIAGWSDGSEVSNSQFISTYFDKTLSPGFTNDAGRADLGRTAQELKTQSTYADWDFENVWTIEEGVNGGYPYLIGFDMVRLGGAPGSIRIVIKDEDDNPVEDAEIVIIDSDGEETILSDDGDGEYSGTVTKKDEIYVVIYDGDVVGEFEHNGDDAVSIDITVTPKGKEFAVNITVTLERDAQNDYATNDGFGYNNAGKLIIAKDGEAVYTATEEELTLSENDDGKVVITIEAKLAAGNYTVTFTKNGYVAEAKKITVTEATSLDLTPVCGDIKESTAAEHGDGIVDVDDYVRILRGLDPEALEYLRLVVDLNEDGIINVKDLSIIKSSFGYGK